MNELNGIIFCGKVYEAADGEGHSCLTCDLIDDAGDCICRDFCFNQGRNNIFRFSQELTDKINGK